EYQQLLADMINGPMYLGWIIEAAVPGFEGANPRALLLTQKGEHSVATYPRSMWENLPQNGDMLLCAGPLVVGSVPTELNAMPSVAMEFVRRLENNLVECKSPEGRVSTHHCVGQMRQILEAQADIETTEEGKEPAVYVEPLKRGDMVYACRLSGAIIARAPVDEERAQGRYVDTTKIPDVVADRDIGKPH